MASRREHELSHHGILGQKWGVRNGPPYPLDASDHSAAEKQAEKKKTSRSSGLTDDQKKAIKIGAIAAGATLAAIGGAYLYKSGALDKLAVVGKNKVEAMLGQKLAGGVDESVLKKLAKPESISETLAKANPNRGNSDYKNNCTLCSLAGFLRNVKGYDVVAGKTDGKQQNLGGIIEDCFKGAEILDGSALKFGHSVDDASDMLVKRFGNNASGVVSIQWKNVSGGHAFNWFIKDGKVTFADFQGGRDHQVVTKYWKQINPNDSMTIARLDQAELIEESVLKYFGIRG